MDIRAFLHSERLFTENPYDQECLLPKDKISAVSQSIVFDNFYRSKIGKIYCHICGGHRHINGITGVLSGGERILFGSSCAKDFFGPEIAKLCAGELRHRTQKAVDRFLILDISNAVEPVELWMASYRKLLGHIDIAWADIHLKYPKEILSVLSNLQKNNGRLVEAGVLSVGGKAQKVQRFEQHTILMSITCPQAIPYLKQTGQRASLVDIFTNAVRSMKSEPNSQVFSNLANMYKKTMDAAQIVDDCLAFTTDFFHPEKMSIISEWLEQRRLVRIGDVSEIKKRNLGNKFINIMGAGVEKPPMSLSQSLTSTSILNKIDQRRVPIAKSLSDSHSG